MSTETNAETRDASEEGNRPRTWLITGAAGFIGSHLSDAVLARGDVVLGIDNLTTGRIENVQHLLDHPRFRLARADVTDTHVLDRLASDSSIIVHLAAAVGVELVTERPAYTIETNVLGTEAVLRAALRYGSRVLIASTSEVYGKGTRIPFSEDDDILLGPTSRSRWGYAASKMVDEFLALGYARESGLQVTPFRLFNTIGPRQSGRYGMVVPRFVAQALRNEPITIFGDGTQRRCFCDVDDVVRAIIGLALHSGATGQIFNIGSQEEVSIQELAQRAIRITGSSSEVTYTHYSDAYPAGFEDMHRRVPDTTRIRTLLDWVPAFSLDQTLERVMTYVAVGELTG